MGAYTPSYETPGVLVLGMTRSLADPAVEGSFDVGIEVADRIEGLLGVAREEDVPVFFTRGGLAYHTNAAADLEPVERNGWPLTADLQDEPERLGLQYEILPSLEPERSVVVTKHAPSAFFGTMLQTYLAALGVRRLIVCGMMTSGCVRATVVDGFSYNCRVVVSRECVADHRRELHERTLEDVDGRYAFVRSIDDVVEQLR